MYGIPADFDPSVFVGANLQQVCFGPYIIHFNFGAPERLQLAVEASYEHSSDDGWTDAVKLPLSTSRLMQLTNHEVVEAVVESAERLRLSFDNRQSLVVIDDSDQYESFHVQHGERGWIV